MKPSISRAGGIKRLLQSSEKEQIEFLPSNIMESCHTQAQRTVWQCMKHLQIAGFSRAVLNHMRFFGSCLLTAVQHIDCSQITQNMLASVQQNTLLDIRTTPLKY
jgi:hypothetical protein